MLLQTVCMIPLPYVNSNWSYSPETTKLGFDLCDLDLWPWPFAWTSLLSMVITPENFMTIWWWEHNEKGVTDWRTDPQNGVLWLLLSINLGAFFLCGYWVLCGCVCMSRPTKRCLVATFVHKFGCLFSCVAIGFVWLQINKIATKVPTVPKNSHRSGVL